LNDIAVRKDAESVIESRAQHIIDLNFTEHFSTAAVVDFDKNLFVSTGVLGEGGFGKVLSTMFADKWKVVCD
jgi:hypothetical protein